MAQSRAFLGHCIIGEFCINHAFFQKIVDISPGFLLMLLQEINQTGKIMRHSLSPRSWRLTTAVESVFFYGFFYYGFSQSRGVVSAV